MTGASNYKDTSLGAAIDRLAGTIATRRTSPPETSYTAKLLSDGVERCAQKFGEEAVETVIAAAAGDAKSLTAEAADALYHLLVLLEASGVSTSEVGEELSRRAGTSGLDEKASR